MNSTIFRCPECECTDVTVKHVQSFMVNTGEHYCHSVKIQDAGAESQCLSCGWVGFRSELDVHNTGG